MALLSTQASCPLCGQRGPLTNEDIVPMWARRHVIQMYGAFPPGQAPARFKVRICRACNEHLGRQFENAAPVLIRPLFDGEATTLAGRQQVQLAAWITKTTLLGNFANSCPDAWGHEILRGLLWRMMDDGLPPPYTSVRIASRDPEDDGAGEVDLQSVAPHDSMPRYAFFGLWGLGHLAWEMVTGGTVDILHFSAWADTSGSALVRIWPPQQPGVSWPPPRRLSWAQAEAMRATFMEARQPGVEVRPPLRRVWHGPEDSA